jgi:hypothetical protein
MVGFGLMSLRDGEMKRSITPCEKERNKKIGKRINLIAMISAGALTVTALIITFGWVALSSADKKAKQMASIELQEESNLNVLPSEIGDSTNSKDCTWHWTGGNKYPLQPLKVFYDKDQIGKIFKIAHCSTGGWTVIIIYSPEPRIVRYVVYNHMDKEYIKTLKEGTEVKYGDLLGYAGLGKYPLYVSDLNEMEFAGKK